MLDLDSFLSYATQGYTLVPVWRTLPATGVTPLAVYQALANRGDDYLYETRRHVRDDAEPFVPHLSVIGLACAERIELDGKRLRIRRHGRSVRERFDDDPLAALQREFFNYRVPPCVGLPEYAGGLFGYFGFETTRMIEPRLDSAARKAAPTDLPDVVQLVSRELIVFDHSREQIYVIVHAPTTCADNGARTVHYHRASARVDALCRALADLPPARALPVPPPMDTAQAYAGVHYTFSQPAFQAAVERVKEYIRAGDLMQVVLSQRMTRPLTGDAVDYYRALTALSAAPYSYLLNLGDSHIVGVSPEMLIQQRRGRAVSRPMAGTRRRGADAAEDRRLEAELMADPKEIAEHMMLVDLARNDLGRVAVPGSVKVEAMCAVERYSHVMHIVSTVTAQARAGSDAIDALRATFPAGTLSGAPKVRALEVIQELEPFARGVYGGAVGYLTWHGDVDLAIAIRTAVLHRGQVHIQAGAGIVFDSRPEREWQETIEKGAALVLAAAMTTAHKSGTPATTEWSLPFSGEPRVARPYETVLHSRSG